MKTSPSVHVSKKNYEAEVDTLRQELVQAQFALKQQQIPVVIIVTGVDGAGKGEVIQRLNEWMDPRGIDTQAFGQTSDEEQERPDFWRFWRVLPARGRIAIFFGSWYTQPILQRVYGHWKTRQLDRAAQRIASFEKMLADDDALILKFSLYLTKKQQRRRLEALEDDPTTHWRVLPSDWKHHKNYERFVQAAERLMGQTQSLQSPWFTVKAADSDERDLTVGRLLLTAVNKRLTGARPPAAPASTSIVKARAVPTRPAITLDDVDLSQRLSKERYEKKLAKLQGELNQLAWQAAKEKLSSVVVFEGWDAAGKGSSIRRVTQAIDPRLYRLIPVAAPNDEERAHHYLWRFWRHLPRAGRFALYDRSWYGRVLVERVEKFATPQEWGRAYSEINEFERQLAEHGIVITKFWVHISKEEQLRRFKKRAEIPYKQFKITEEDWRNRKKWNAYASAVNDMVARTNTLWAPWTLVAGNDKRFARVQILQTICQRLEKALG